MNWHRRGSVTILLLAPVCLLAQPAVDYFGVLNAASHVPARLPGGSIARGSIFSITGEGLGPAALTSIGDDDPTTELAGVRVQIIQNNVTLQALPRLVSGARIEAIMPSAAIAGAASLTVSYQGETSDPVPVNIVDASFGIYSVAGDGFGPGLIHNTAAEEDDSPNLTKAPAAPGQIVSLYGTGLGPDPNPAVEIFVGGKLVTETQSSGGADCCPGMDKLVFRVPVDAPAGCFVPVQVRLAGQVASNVVTMAVEPPGSACTDFAANIPAGGGKTGVIALLRMAVLDDLDPMETLDFKTDAGMATFIDGNGAAGFNPLLALPPTGTCTAFGSVLNIADLLKGSFQKTVSFGSDLNAGTSIAVTGAQGTQSMSQQTNYGYYGGVIGGSLPLLGVRATPLFLAPGTYQVSGAGGADVGPFRASIQVLPEITWTNRDQVSPIDRAKGLTVQWTGGDPSQQVAIFGANVDEPTAATGSFLCVADASAKSFTVPPQILQVLPPTRLQADQSVGALFVGAAPARNPATFTAKGLDAGFAVSVSLGGRTLTFK